ncbi:MAG: NlpC/P60 family protein [Armatimonadota bacterium]
MTFFLRAPRVRRLTASFGLSLTAACIALATLTATFSTPISALARPTKPAKRHSSPPKRVHKAMVRVETARLRSGPSNDHAPTALLDAGRAASVVARKGDWAKLRFATGREGWVRSDLLAISKKTVQLASAAKAAKKTVAANKKKQPKKAVQLAQRPVKRIAAAKPPVKRIAAAKPKAKKILVAKAVAARPVVRKKQAVAVRKPQFVIASKKPARFAFSRPVLRSPKLNPQIAAPVVIRANPVAPESTAAAVMPALSQVAVDDTQNTVQAPVNASEAAAPVQVAMAAALPEAEKAAVPAPPAPVKPVNRNLSRNERIARNALSYRGVPYRMGATGRGAFDCSGFMMYLFDKAGLELPRTAAEQYRKGIPIPKNQLKPGDLVFFKNTYKRGVSHVGIYIGGGKFCHASSGGHSVRTDSLSRSYYVNHWAGARRAR